MMIDHYLSYIFYQVTYPYYEQNFSYGLSFTPIVEVIVISPTYRPSLWIRYLKPPGKM